MEGHTMTQADDTPAPQGQYVQANGLNIYYEEYGEGEPLILIHGGLATIEVWRSQLPTFGKHFRTIAPDSRGHGRTDNPTGSFSYRLMAADLAAFIQALGLRKPLIYGYSDGGQIALELGMRHPDLARALVVGAAWFKFSDTYRELMIQMLGDEHTEDVDTARMEQENGGYVEMLRAWHSHVYGQDYWKTLLKQIKPMWSSPLNYSAEDFRRITSPTLVIAGDRDSVVPVEEAVEMYRLLPNAALGILPNADHLQAPDHETFVAIVLDFLLRHSGRDV